MKKKTTTKTKTIQGNIEAGILYKEDYDKLLTVKKQLTLCRTSSVIKDLTNADLNVIYSIHKKYYPKHTLQTKGCNNCVFKAVLRVAKLLHSYEQIK